MRQWRPYVGGRKIADLDDGSYIVVPDASRLIVPLACEVCSALYRDRDDEVAHREFGCCGRCALRWAHARREDWRRGWRPLQHEVELDVKGRPPLVFVLDVADT